MEQKEKVNQKHLDIISVLCKRCRTKAIWAAMRKKTPTQKLYCRTCKPKIREKLKQHKMI